MACSVPPNLAGPSSCFVGPAMGPAMGLAVVPAVIELYCARGTQTFAELASRPFVIQLE